MAVGRDQGIPTSSQRRDTGEQQEAAERARYNIAVLLGNNMETFPENRRVLEMLLESEQSKRIRQKVANMLY